MNLPYLDTLKKARAYYWKQGEPDEVLPAFFSDSCYRYNDYVYQLPKDTSRKPDITEIVG